MNSDDSPSPAAGEDFDVLLIASSPGEAQLFEEYVHQSEGTIDVQWETNPSAGFTALDEIDSDVLVVDLGLTSREECPTIEEWIDAVEGPVVVLANRDNLDIARAALEAGASEYLQKDDLSPVLVSRTLRWVVERSGMKATLSHQDTWLRSITENLSSAIYRSTAENGLVYVNEAFARMFGYESPEAVLDANPEEMYAHPEERERLLRIQNEKGGIDGVEVEYRRTDGSTFVGLASSTSVCDENGEVRYYDGLITDITERKEAERERRVMSEALEQAREAVFITEAGPLEDSGPRIVYVNPAFEDMTGYAEEDVLGDPPRILMGPKTDREVLDALRGAMEAGTTWAGEMINYRNDGTAYFAQWNVAPVRDQDQNIEYWISVQRDVTEEHRREEELRKSRKRWQQLVESQRDAVQISVDGVIQYTNPAGVELMGADSRDEVIGRHVDEFPASDEAKADFADRIEQIQQGNPTELYEHEIERLDGERRIVESYSVPIEYKGEQAAQGIIRDVTERKRTQRQLQQAQKMDTVGALAGGIAHDFNNILHSVTAYVEMVKEDLDENDVNQSLLNRSSQGLDRARDLVEKLLTFSRQDRAEQSERVDIGTIVRESIDLVDPSLPRNVTIRTDIGEGCTIQGDPGQIHQVAMNIMTNAGQAIEEHDSTEEHVLDVDVHSLDVDDDLARRHLNLEPGRYVRLSISDTGPGMDTKTQERIFEPFFTTKEVNSGTGLGLSVVHGIVQSHDGEITVYSKPNEGTTFNVYLPYAAEEDIASGASVETGGRPSSDVGHILFVDDDEHITELETMRLRRLGYDVTTCKNAPEALQTFDASPNSFDLVLTDYAMPEMNGLDLTRKLRARNYDRPIILMSGFSAQVSPDEIQTAGATSFLRKPVGSDELKQTLEHILETERQGVRELGVENGK